MKSGKVIYSETTSGVAVNVAGAGHIAGLGVGNNGEPGIVKKRKSPKSLWDIVAKRGKPTKNVKK